MIDQAVAVILGAILDLAEGTPTVRSTALLTLAAAVAVTIAHEGIKLMANDGRGRHVRGNPRTPPHGDCPPPHPDRVQSTDQRDVSRDTDRNTWHQNVDKR